jgi:mannose-6-phosphate isomerase-like protein (cupin superfamily)
MNLTRVVPSVLSSLADLYENAGFPPVQRAIDLLRQTPEQYAVDFGILPEVTSHLTVALKAIPTALRNPILLAFANCPLWRAGRASFPPGFQGRSAILEILGPDGLAISHTVRSGLYLQSPECLYPPHSHAAEEFYLVLSGNASWQRGEGEFEEKLPGALIHHRSCESHAMKTFGSPLLAAWIWIGEDLTYDTYRID